MGITDNAGAALGRKVGPLPVGGWAAIGIGAFVVVKLLKGGKGGSSGTVTIPDAFAGDTGGGGGSTGDTSGGAGTAGGSTGGTGAVGTGSLPAPFHGQRQGLYQDAQGHWHFGAGDLSYTFPAGVTPPANWKPPLPGDLGGIQPPTVTPPSGNGTTIPVASPAAGSGSTAAHTPLTISIRSKTGIYNAAHALIGHVGTATYTVTKGPSHGAGYYWYKITTRGSANYGKWLIAKPDAKTGKLSVA